MTPLLSAAAVFVLVLGLGGLVAVSARQRGLVRRSLPLSSAGDQTSLRLRADRRFRRTRLGSWLELLLSQGTWSRLHPIDVVLIALGLSALTWVVVQSAVSSLLAPAFALLALLAIVLVLRRQRAQRHERFVAQMPQLARILSNATSAGLSLRTAMQIAADEMPEPVASEMQRVSRALAYGESTEAALTALRDRMPSREIDVLVSTLVVASRAGGSLVSSLRRISETLEERKQTRREILTFLAEARSTALLIPVIGLGSLILVRTIDESAIDRMLVDPIGQAIFVAAAVLYAVGGFLFQRVTRVDS